MIRFHNLTHASHVLAKNTQWQYMRIAYIRMALFASLVQTSRKTFLTNKFSTFTETAKKRRHGLATDKKIALVKTTRRNVDVVVVTSTTD